MLGRFLRALGAPPGEVPADPEERIAAYRSLLAGRRVLLILDDAAGEEQVRPLLPPTGHSATIVTSRRQLGAFLDTARWTVPALRREDSLRLLARIAGTARIAAEPDAAGQVVDTCGNSPLAVSVAAGRLAVRTDWAVAELARRLAAEHGRLDALSVGDLDVRATIGLSYHGLGSAGRRLLRRLSLLWTSDWPAWVADELCAGPAEALLDELVDVHLVEPVGVDLLGQQRFRLHDLIGEYGRERARDEENPGDLAAISDGLLRAWLGLARLADDALEHGFEYGTDLLDCTPPPGPTATARTSPADWFEAERGTLVAGVSRARRLGLADLAGELALRISGFLRSRGHMDDLVGTLREALAAAPDTHDRLRARLAQTLFAAYVAQDRDGELPALTERMLAAVRVVDDPDLRIRSLLQAGTYAKRRGRLGEASAYYREALSTCDDTSPHLLATALASVATVDVEAGRPEEALPLSGRAVAVQRRQDTPLMMAMRLCTHADALADARRLDEAEEAFTEAVALSRIAGHEAAQAYAGLRLGDVAVRRGDEETAEELIRQALDTFERLSDPGSHAFALRSLGDHLLARGRPEEALAPLRQALDTWERVRLPLEAARQHARLAVALDLLGDPRASGHRAAYERTLGELGLDERALRLHPQRTAEPANPRPDRS